MHTHLIDLPVRPSSSHHRDNIYKSFTHVFDAPQTNTDLVIAEALRKTYPDLHLTISSTYGVNYLAFAASGQATAVPVDGDEAVTSSLKWISYAPPAKRMDGGEGALRESIQFGKYLYTWNGKEYLLYIIIGMQGSFSIRNSYLLGSSEEDTEGLMLAAGHYANELHDEILVFDGGYWEKSKDLWKSVENSTWDDVILDEGMKKAIMGEINKFFDSRDRYARLKVPWKRGIIYYGPPGNGKTISIKATMHALSRLQSPVPTLYVRSLSSYGGPEYAISSIFHKARQFAPCYLVFEDLDSIVTDNVRSYFLNEVDGLESNDGILMIGSTNHLERLDPGISKRPSRFDRKYFFPDPDEEQRVQYCRFWRKKLQENEDVEFPEVLDKPIARITKGFSFAYMQEAFVASLLAIAAQEEDEEEEEDTPGKYRGGDDARNPALGLAQPDDHAYGQQSDEEHRHLYGDDSLAGYDQPPPDSQALSDLDLIFLNQRKELAPELKSFINGYGEPNPNQPPSSRATLESQIGDVSSWAPAPIGQFVPLPPHLKVPERGNRRPWKVRREKHENRDGKRKEKQKEKELDKYVLWRQLKKQVEILRRELEE